MKIMRTMMLITGLLVSQANAAETTIIAALGDSLTNGYGIAQEDAFYAQLERRLIADGHTVKVLNFGVSGDTTAGGLSRVDKVIEAQPALTIVELGANDLLRGLPPEQAKANLDAIMTRLGKAGSRMVLIGFTAPMTTGAAYAGPFNSMYPELAATHRAALYPNYFDGVYGVQGMMQQDGVHPLKEGIALIVSKVAPLIEQELARR